MRFSQSKTVNYVFISTFYAFINVFHIFIGLIYMLSLKSDMYDMTNDGRNVNEDKKMEV